MSIKRTGQRDNEFYQIQSALEAKQDLNARLTTIASMDAPVSDRLLYWDQSAGQFDWASVLAPISISASGVLNLDSPLLTSIDGLSNPGVDRIMFWDSSSSAIHWLAPHDGMSITGTNLSVDVANSVQISSGNVQLVNDASSPGTGKFYGTNTSGTKGWHDFGDYVQSEGGFRLNRTTSAQSITSTSYTNVSGSNWFASSENGDVEYVVWLRFPTASTSGTILFDAATSFGTPDLSLISAVGMGDQYTVSVNDASTEVTVDVKATGSANTICPVKIVIRGESSSVVQWTLRTRKGTISNNFEVYRLSYIGRLS